MSDQLLTTAARLDPHLGAWVLAENPLGPGGAASIDVAGGVSVHVDATDPLRLIEVVVELPDCDRAKAPTAEAFAAVTAILGAEPAAAVTNAVGGDEAVRSVFNLAVDPATAGQRRLLGRLALLDAIRTDDAPAAAWWAAEAALLCARADVRLGLSERADVEARVAADVLADLDVQGLPPGAAVDRITEAATAVAARIEERDRRRAERIRDVVARLRSGPLPPPLSEDEVAAAFERLIGRGPLAEELVTTRGRLRDVRMSRPWVVEGTFAIGAWLLQEGQVRPEEIAVPGIGRFTWNRDVVAHPGTIGVGVRRTFGAAEMLVQVPLKPAVTEGALATYWARVYESTTGNQIATCPLGTDSELPGFAVARVAVPRRYEPSDLEIDVTRTPTRAPGGPETRAVKSALAWARDAGHAERMGWFSAARNHWEGCADMWAVVRDADRRAVALVFAAQNAHREGDEAAATRLAAAAQAEPLLWADRLLHAPREVAVAFLAEAPGVGGWQGA